MKNEEIKEVVKDASIEDNNIIDNPIDENLDNGPKDNLKDTVKKRNSEAATAKEELIPPGQDQEEEEKPNNTLKYLGLGLITISAAAYIINKKLYKKPINTTNIENEIK